MASLAPFIVRRGAAYHLRVRIPLDLVAVVGRPEYKRSLKTSCPKVARRRAAKARGRLAEVFEEIRRMRNPREEQIQSLLDMVAEWEEVEDMRRQADNLRTEATALKSAVAELTELERVGNDIARFSERWQPEIARLAADRNAAKETAPLFPALRECLSAFHRENDNAGSGGEAVELGLQLQNLATELQQVEDAVASKDAVIEEKDRQLGVQMGTLGAMLANLGIPNRNVHTETVTAYLHTHYLEKKKLRDDAKRHIVGYVTLFAKLTGDRPLAEYNAGEIVSYIRLLEQVKNTYGKSPKDKDLSVEGLLASSEGQKTLNVTSLKKHTGHVKAFLIDAAKHYRFSPRLLRECTQQRLGRSIVSDAVELGGCASPSVLHDTRKSRGPLGHPAESKVCPVLH